MFTMFMVYVALMVMAVACFTLAVWMWRGRCEAWHYIVAMLLLIAAIAFSAVFVGL